MRVFIAIFILFFSNLLPSIAQATPHTPKSSSPKTSVGAVPDDNHKKNKHPGNSRKANTPHPEINKVKTVRTTQHKPQQIASRTKNNTPALIKTGLKKSQTKNGVRLSSSNARVKHGLKNTDLKNRKSEEKGLALSAAHKKRYQQAKLTAMNKLMSQVGKPYRWGGSSPFTGFDCSGLVYYAYKDVVKIPIPRTANEMYHLRDAAPIQKSELESGDLVFFRINNRGVADHVGVYLGNGKFIQSPRTGSDIRISKLSEDYWQDHYVGARRVVTPQTMR
ncbi:MULTISPECIES: C40 family peptidase [unclassified Brenneria]|uniref:C40 family peptidase n=1 Tax=unclassified Brenneria TaxID=2634434 RepID=UPI0018F0AC50|nr:C40 family peptidase [Brenneria sp. L3-3C-1]MBJ7221011.1 C40 family peptidase [Brenneria sp. L3-3C-1]MEE3642252.1 C40 family peptidase [Brenneria sp. L3_3C_1]